MSSSSESTGGYRKSKHRTGMGIGLVLGITAMMIAVPRPGYGTEPPQETDHEAVQRLSQQSTELQAQVKELEAKLIPLGAKPHWGKVIHAGAATLAPLYPRIDDFRARATSYDPKGKFRNAYLDRHVFG